MAAAGNRRFVASPRRRTLTGNGGDDDVETTSIDTLRNELRSTSEMNVQLQHDYDDALQRLAQAELTIDQLRFGVQTEVNKTVYFTVKEEEEGRRRRRDERRANRSQSRSPYRSIGTGAMGTNAGIQADDFLKEEEEEEEEEEEGESSSEREVTAATTLSSATQGQRATLESAQMGLVFQTRALQDQLENMQAMMQETAPRRAEIVRDLERIGKEVKRLEGNVTKTKESQAKLSQTKGIGEPANVDHLRDELEHLKLMMAETQDAVNAQLKGQKRRSDDAAEVAGPLEEREEGPTMSDLMNKLTELEGQQKMNPTLDIATEIRQLKEAMEQFQFQLDEERIAHETPTDTGGGGGDGPYPADPSRQLPSNHSAEIGTQASQGLPGEYLSSLIAPVSSGETPPLTTLGLQQQQQATSSSSSSPAPSQSNNRSHIPRFNAKTTSSSSSSSSSSSTPKQKRSKRTPPTHQKSHSNDGSSLSSSSSHQKRQQRKTRPGFISDDELRRRSLIHINDTQPIANKHVESRSVQADIPTEARSSRIPRPVAKKGKRNQYPGDSFDRDSGYLGSMAPPNSHPGVSQQPPLTSSPPQSSVSQIEEEPEVQSSLSHRPPLQPSYYFPYNPGAVVPDTSAVDSLREEVRRLREQLLDGRTGGNGVSAAQPPPRASSLATQTVEEDDGELSVRDSPRERLSESSFHRPLNQEPAPLTSSDDGDERRRRRRRDGYVRPPQPLEIPSDDGVDDDDSAGDARRIDEKKNQYHRHREAKSYPLISESESDRSARRRQRTTPVAKTLFKGQSSQTPPKWKSTTATRPREDFATDSSEASSLTTSSSREGDSSLECPHCGNSFSNETGQRHRHQTSHSKKCQTPESFLHERAKEEPVEVIRLKKKSKPRRPVRIYLDEDEEEGGNGRDKDVVDEPSSILQTQKPKASSTPRVYVADPSPTDSDDERESIVLRRRPRRKERSPAVVVIERDLESPPPPSPPSPVYVYRRRPRTSTYRFDDDDDDDYDRHPRTRRSKSAYVLEEDREPRVIRQSKPRYVLEDDDDYGDADDDVHVLYRRRRSRVRAVPRRTMSPVRQSRDVFVDDLELALSRVKRETRRAANQSRSMLSSASLELDRSSGLY